MSSELSGRYRLELEQKYRIENDCRAALKACLEQRANEKAQWQQKDAAWEQKAEQAAGQAAADQTAAEEQARKKMWALRRRLGALKEWCRPLDGAEELHHQLQLVDAMLTDSSSCAFAKARLDWLEQEVIPRCEAQAAAARQAEKAAAEPASVRRSKTANVRQDFVPLAFEAQQEAPREQTPWEKFCSRVQQMLEQAGGAPLPEMTALAQRLQDTEPGQQNERMLQERELLARLERQAARMAQMKQSSEEHQSEQQQYRFLCEKLGIAENTYSGEELRKENDRLFALWCAQEEENYIQKSLQEAFAQADIPFAALEKQRSVAAELSGNMRLDMARDELGTFSIEVYGVADSAQEAAAQKDRMVEQCRHFCRQFPQIVDALREKGVLLEDIGQIEPAKTTLDVRVHSSRRRTVETDREREMQSF